MEGAFLDACLEHDVSKNYQNILHLEHKLLYCSVQTDYVQTVQNVQTQAMF